MYVSIANAQNPKMYLYIPNVRTLCVRIAEIILATVMGVVNFTSGCGPAIIIIIMVTVSSPDPLRCAGIGGWERDHNIKKA